MRSDSSPKFSRQVESQTALIKLFGYYDHLNSKPSKQEDPNAARTESLISFSKSNSGSRPDQTLCQHRDPRLIRSVPLIQSSQSLVALVDLPAEHERAVEELAISFDSEIHLDF